MDPERLTARPADDARTEPGQTLAMALDDDHAPVLREPLALCLRCGLSADEGLRGPQHLPQPDEPERARAWLTAHARSDADAVGAGHRRAERPGAGA